MIVTTLESVDGHVIGDTLGLVRGRAMCSRPRDRFPAGQPDALSDDGMDVMERVFNEARERAHQSLSRNATLLDADAVVGLRTEIVELSNGSFMVFVWGTAVSTVLFPHAAPAIDDAGEQTGSPVDALGSEMHEPAESCLRH